jgi:hypothetical protein
MLSLERGDIDIGERREAGDVRVFQTLVILYTGSSLGRRRIGIVIFLDNCCVLGEDLEHLPSPVTICFIPGDAIHVE